MPVRARARVEPRTWEAFRLTAYEGLSGDAAAARLGMSSEGVFKAKSRVMGFLREDSFQQGLPEKRPRGNAGGLSGRPAFGRLSFADRRKVPCSSSSG